MFILPDFFLVRISLRNILFGFSTNYFRGLGLRIRVMEGWSIRRFEDVVKEDMAEVEVTEEDTEDRINWRRQIRCGDP